MHANHARVEFWDYTINLVGEVFLAVGRERGSYVAAGRRNSLSIRTTRFSPLRREVAADPPSRIHR
jgi:hypothetical protein